MSLERSIIANYEVMEEPIIGTTNNFGFVKGRVIIAPEAGQEPRHLRIDRETLSRFYEEPTDYSRIPNSDSYKGRISAIFFIPKEIDDSAMPFEDKLRMMLDTSYAILTRVVEDDKNTISTGYEPKILHFAVSPGLEPELYFPFLEADLDAIIIQTVPTGGVPIKGEFSFIPFIRKATELRIPVYLLRGSLSAAERPPSYPYRRSLESIYEPEIHAIRAGAKPVEVEAVKAGGTPLEIPDASLTLEVIQVIRSVYKKRPGYHEGIEEVTRIFSHPEFMEQVKRIREE